MTPARLSRPGPTRAIVIGAGIGGLATALRLAAAGLDVTVLERASAPGGRMRQVPSAAGPVDAGPTVLTLRGVFDDLFAAAGARLEDHVRLLPQPILARHFWPDGGVLDLFADHDRSRDAVAAFAGGAEAAAFDRFCAEARALFTAFEAPMMRAADPRLTALAGTVLRNPGLLGAMAPGRTLAGALTRRFRDPRLAQLFGRYATYVGGSPYGAPALLSLIWEAEARGVWAVEGGLHALARAVAGLAERLGARFVYAAEVAEIGCTSGRAARASLTDGRGFDADLVVFNGDPRALATGRLGPAVAGVAPQTRRRPRSLSARVWSFAARYDGPALIHHNVFFSVDYAAEFRALGSGAIPPDPTLYICAEDRARHRAPSGPERFEIIENAAPLTAGGIAGEEFETCRTRVFTTLGRFGLRFDPLPEPAALTTPAGFEALFPASAGSLYGQSPHGMTASLARPRARTAVPGLYLAGGGAHPGAGVPMAALSGRHAAETILRDLGLTSPSRRTVMHGGMSTA